MSRTISFADARPIPRFDNLPWTKCRIEESASGEIWVPIDLKNLVPLDADPSNPRPRSFTTDEASDTIGLFYRFVFLDEAGSHQAPTPPIRDTEDAGPEFLATVQQVARKNMSRAKDTYGNIVGTYNDVTTPTATQVAGIISDVATEVADTIGDNIPDSLINDAQNVVALRAAMQVELDYFAEQVNTGRSIYPQLERQYISALAALQKAVTEAAAGDGTVQDTAPSLSASMGGFPEARTTWREIR